MRAGAFMKGQKPVPGGRRRPGRFLEIYLWPVYNNIRRSNGQDFRNCLDKRCRSITVNRSKTIGVKQSMKQRLLIIVALALVCAFIAACARAENSVGIIGGADGPTRIFVSSSNAQPDAGQGGGSAGEDAASAAGGLRKPAIIILAALFLAVVLYRIRKTGREQDNRRPERKPPGT